MSTTETLNRGAEIIRRMAAGETLAEVAESMGYRGHAGARHGKDALLDAMRADADARSFGVEIEFVGATYEAVITEMQARGMTVRFAGYTHAVETGWKIVTDGSVLGGYELVSPILVGAAGRDEVRSACAALAAAGARVNVSCGLHVHHDFNGETAEVVRSFVRTYAARQDAIDSMVAPSRRNNCRWAQRISPVTLDGLDAAADGYRTLSDVARYADRYQTVNVAAYAKYGTVEVRQHQGTIDADKIVAWVDFGQALIAAAKFGLTDVVPTDSADAMLKNLAKFSTLPKGTAKFLAARTKVLAGRRVAVPALAA